MWAACRGKKKRKKIRTTIGQLIEKPRPRWSKEEGIGELGGRIGVTLTKEERHMKEEGDRGLNPSYSYLVKICYSYYPIISMILLKGKDNNNQRYTS